ncbi:hypothetical protein L0156_26190 [bacterium]|nr:hypothetical protein [bacterium]
MKTRTFLVSAFALFAILLMFPQDAQSITAWARKYNVSCGTCHAVGYRLTREGIDFMRRGHHYAKDEGSKGLEDYLALNSKVRFNDGNDSDSIDNKIGEVTFEHHAFALYGGGLIADKFSFFTEVYLHEREGNPTNVDTFKDGGRTKLAEAYLQYTKGDNNYFTLRAGQIASQLWYLQGAGGRVSETRNFLVNNATVKTNGGIQNNWLPRQRDYGVEAGMQYGDLHGVFALANGNGNSPTNVVENKGQSAKDFYTSWDYTVMDKAMIGFFYHNGNLEDPLNPVVPEQNQDDFHRLGLTFNSNPTDRLWLLANYVRGKDEDSIPAPGFLSDVESNGFYVEADYLLHVDRGIVPFARYDHFTHDGKSTPTLELNTDTDVFVLGCSVNLFQEQRGRVVIEWQYQKQEEANVTKIKDQNLRIELSFML